MKVLGHRDLKDGIPYPYFCTNCGFEEELYYSMNDDSRPKNYDCPICEKVNSMDRNFSGSTITIPFQWTTDDSPKFDKRPSGKRKLHPVEKNIN